MKLKTLAAGIIMGAVFVAAPASASSDYGLVVEVTNKLIDEVRFLEGDVAQLRQELNASKATLQRVEHERDNALEALEGMKSKVSMNERRIGELEASIDIMRNGIKQAQAAKAEDTGSSEALKKQEDRLKAYLSPSVGK